MSNKRISTSALLREFGIDHKRFRRAFKRFKPFIRDYREFKALMSEEEQHFVSRFEFHLDDRYDTAGIASGHYFHQDLHVAQQIYRLAPKRHVDVGSRVDGFVAHVASFRTIEVVDIRPQAVVIPNIEFLQADMMGDLPAELVECTDSLSCLHTLEHFGLGRYGDPINPNGHLIGFSNLTKMLRRGGRLYLSVPMGAQRIVFNAHRIFSLSYLLEMIGADYSIESFSYVDDHGAMHANVSLEQAKVESDYDCGFGLAIFELKLR